LSGRVGWLQVVWRHHLNRRVAAAAAGLVEIKPCGGRDGVGEVGHGQ